MPYKDKEQEKARYLRNKNDKEWVRSRKNQQLKTLYGITIDEYEEMSERQNHVCAICKCSETAITRWGTPRSLAVDHCHQSGKVRGLLCHNCNIVIGQSKDNIETLKNAITYLQEAVDVLQ
ncbi:endonuclease VII domain-containing protein [Herbiconiux daphne]|uniref:Endonuclease VII domain-containing protein n=1 Tax=Herbiconiux daphne TaxID=2970914 RepID=A0ABT2H9S0_9MICO|nr:endonuclease VII domain-containing protein [Herbiconiux daphne]MCS5736715.1 endonuclease VII domain-containing protein [Herbiconiux daphne]